MTTPINHFLTAFVLLVVFKQLRNLDISFERLILISFASLLPDVFDKIITGSRYPFHSILVSLTFLILFYFLGRHLIQKFEIRRISLEHFTLLFVLISVAYLSHPIMDLEGTTPILYPLDPMGYRIEFQMNIMQSMIPIISEFTFLILREPYDYTITYTKEGTLISTLDLLLVGLLSIILLGIGIERVIRKMETKKRSQE